MPSLVSLKRSVGLTSKNAAVALMDCRASRFTGGPSEICNSISITAAASSRSAALAACSCTLLADLLADLLTVLPRVLPVEWQSLLRWRVFLSLTTARFQMQQHLHDCICWKHAVRHMQPAHCPAQSPACRMAELAQIAHLSDSHDGQMSNAAALARLHMLKACTQAAP